METTPPPSVPLPTLTGPEPPGLHRWKQMLATGAEVPPPPTDETFVSFAIDPDDLKAYQTFVLGPKRRTGSPLLVIIAIATVLLTILEFLPSNRRHSPGSSVFIIILPILILAALLPLLMAWQRRKLKSAAADIFGPQTISLSPRYITSQTQLGDGRIKWHGIKEIHRTQKHLFFQIATGSVHIIPLWAFATPADADAFYIEAKGYQETAKQRI